MTKEEWVKAENSMKATLYINGFRLSIEQRQQGNGFIAIVYVNSFLKGEWFHGKHEESKFLYRSTTSVYSAKFRKSMEKINRRIYSGEKLEDEMAIINQKKTLLMPFFPSFRALRLQYIKDFGNDNITLFNPTSHE